MPRWVSGGGSPSNTTSHGSRPTSLPSGILSRQTVWHNTDGPKKMGRAAVPLWVGGAGSPSNTMSPGSRPTSVPGGIPIHTTVWPQ